MSIYVPSTLTDTDVSTIVEYYGYDYASMVNALIDGTVPDTINEEDVLAFLLVYSPSNADDLLDTLLNPDGTSSYVWMESDETISMLQGYYDQNLNVSEVSVCVEEIGEWLAAREVETSGIVSEVDDFIAEMENIYGDELYTSASSEELESLLTILSAINPRFYLLLILQELHETVEEAIEICTDNIEETTEYMNDSLDIIAMNTDPDDMTLQAEAQVASYEIQNCQQVIESWNNIVEEISNTEASLWELSADLREIDFQTARSIIN